MSGPAFFLGVALLFGAALSLPFWCGVLGLALMLLSAAFGVQGRS